MASPTFNRLVSQGWLNQVRRNPAVPSLMTASVMVIFPPRSGREFTMVTSPMTVNLLSVEHIPDGLELAVVFVAVGEVVEHIAQGIEAQAGEHGGMTRSNACQDGQRGVQGDGTFAGDASGVRSCAAGDHPLPGGLGGVGLDCLRLRDQTLILFLCRALGL